MATSAHQSGDPYPAAPIFNDDLALVELQLTMEVTSPASPATNGLATAAFPTIDPNLVVEYLSSVLQSTLGASRRDLENVGSLLSKSRYSDTVQRCTRFATESQAALYVQKDLAGGGGLDGDGETSSMLYTCPFLMLANLWVQTRSPIITLSLRTFPSPRRRRLRSRF